MAVLSGANLAINLATAGLVLGGGGGGTWALLWVPFLAINAVTLAVFGRAARSGARARRGQGT
jgi:hypothetical protein